MGGYGHDLRPLSSNSEYFRDRLRGARQPGRGHWRSHEQLLWWEVAFNNNLTGWTHQSGLGAVPAVTTFSPTNGPVAGGTSVTITGTAFTGATAVKFGSTAAPSFTVNSATAITAKAPAGISGTVEVTVKTPYGTSPAY